jgi:hypothetical protein
METRGARKTVEQVTFSKKFKIDFNFSVLFGVS